MNVRATHNSFDLSFLLTDQNRPDKHDPTTSRSAWTLDVGQVLVQNNHQCYGSQDSCQLDYGMQNGSWNVCPPDQISNRNTFVDPYSSQVSIKPGLHREYDLGAMVKEDHWN